MIDTLTPEQTAQLAVYRDMGLEVGLAKGPTNREVATECIKEIYDLIQKPRPQKFIFTRSPLEAQRLIHVLVNKDPGEKLLEAYGTMSNDEFVAFILSHFNDEKISFTETYSYGYGSLESYWIMYYRYFKEVLGIKYEDQSDHFLYVFDKLAKNAGWNYLFEECAIFCDRPNTIVMENNVIDCEDGPAIAYDDGYKIWAIRGNLVTEQIVMAPETLTTEQIKSEQNQETKRIMIERYGADKYLSETGATLIDMDVLNFEGSAPRSLMMDQEGFKWLIGTDGSTGRVYHMNVPAEAMTCKQAHEMISGLSEDNCQEEC